MYVLFEEALNNNLMYPFFSPLKDLNVQLCIYSKKCTETKRISILLLAKTKINRLSYEEILMQMKIILISVFLVLYAHLLIFVFADVSSFKTGNYKATRFSSALLFFDAFIVFHLESP